MIDNRRIVFLDCLRIFAIFSVVAGHKFFGHALNFANNETFYAAPRFLLVFLFPFFYMGGVGVVVFFLISGYIITHVLQSEQPTEFFIKRIFRIYPLYVAAVLFQAIERHYSVGYILDIEIILPQLLLIGDFFDTPYALDGAEWTLRVEIMFYLFMGILRYLKLLSEYKKILPWVLIGVTLLFGILPAFPSSGFGKGFFLIFGPFLFLGVFFYLREAKQVSFSLFIGFVFLVVFQYYYLILVHSPRLVGSQFGILGLMVFVLLWSCRARLEAAPAILFFSNLTYSVYLLHNGMWNPIKEMLGKPSVSILHPDTEVLFVLLVICFFMLKLIEKPGIKLGRVVVRNCRKSMTR